MFASKVKKPKVSHRLCKHCNKTLNVKTYKEHKRLYYDQATRHWYQAQEEHEEASPTSQVAPHLDDTCASGNESDLDIFSGDDSMAEDLNEGDLDLPEPGKEPAAAASNLRSDAGSRTPTEAGLQAVEGSFVILCSMHVMS